jgi:hypothetical protein
METIGIYLKKAALNADIRSVRQFISSCCMPQWPG